MSSLAASQADGFYFPPEYLDNEVNKKMGLSKYQGSKGANQYQQKGIIRFELPFDAWCLKCKRHMSKGLRFNAKKDKCGNYFSTVIFSFSTKCPSCDNPFVIKTDPQHNTYDYSEGLRKHEQDFEPEAGDGIIEATSVDIKKKLAEDPIFKLQHDKEDRERAMTAKTRLDNLVELSDLVYKPDYDRNSALRSSNRSRRNRQKELAEEGAQLGLSIPLVEPAESDTAIAKATVFRSTTGINSGFAISQRLKVVDIKSQSIFGGGLTGGNDAKKRKRSSTGPGPGPPPPPVTSSSASRRRDQVKQAMCKQAVHKISMKDVKLAGGGSSRSTSSSSRTTGCDGGGLVKHLSANPPSIVVSIRKKNSPAAGEKQSSTSGMKLKASSVVCSREQQAARTTKVNTGGLSLLSSVYDSDSDDAQ
jgi:hypothetical protein